MEEAGKEGIGLVRVDAGLACPIEVWDFNPPEIVICKVPYFIMEGDQRRWSCNEGGCG